MTVEELYNKMKKIDLFMGHYDAVHGNEVFMYGVGMVMEYIANEISEEEYELFSETFTKNMIESEKKK